VKRLLFSFLTLANLISSPTQAQEIDFRAYYSAVRANLLANGWTPAAEYDPYNKSACKYSREWWCSLPEYTNCSSTGIGACDTLWRSPDGVIYRIGNNANSLGGKNGRTAQVYPPEIAVWLCRGGEAPRISCTGGGIPRIR